MKEIHTEIEINASGGKVWRVLTDFAAYPKWNPFVRRGEGEVSVGARLPVYIQPSGGNGMLFSPTVLVAEPNRQPRWLDRLWLPGLFDGEHSFSFEPLGDGHLLIQSNSGSAATTGARERASEPLIYRNATCAAALP
jgi:hypothetical protein